MYKLFLIGVGLVDLYFTGRILFDANFARKYVAESPKAFIWRKMFGAEKTLKLIKYLFAPAGFALGLVLIWLGFTT